MTFRGSPLYTLAQDTPGTAKGEGLKDVGVWHAAVVGSTPATTTETTTTTTGGYPGGYGDPYGYGEGDPRELMPAGAPAPAEQPAVGVPASSAADPVGGSEVS